MPEEKSTNTKVPEYVSDKIGEEYMNWEDRDIIFITAPTGTGKSYFILHIFLKWIVRNNYKMLYLVNRKILKEQLEEELHGEVEDEIYQEFGIERFLPNHIEVSTYQSIENGLKGKKYLETNNFIQGFQCVVCDECHYFYSDSNFNTSTELSYLFLRKVFNNKLQIYISATPDKIRENIDAYVVEEIESVAGRMPKDVLFKGASNRTKEYSVKNSYDYIEISIFEKIEDLIDIVRRNVNVEKEKWLIFVDSIDLGKDLKNELLNGTSTEEDSDKNEYKISDNEVIFLDAHYEKETEAAESVEEIAREKISSKKIIISTAVMDNGISIHDRALRNIVILADTKETFIQMLGRKRKDGKKVNLYICKQDIRHFERRKKHVEKVLEYCNKYWNELAYINEPYVFLNAIGKVFKKRYIEIKGENVLINYQYCLANQQAILNELLTNPISAKYIREFCYCMDGFLMPNMFSILRCLELKSFYKTIIKDLENDEYAFAKRQAEWLEIPEKKFESSIQESKKNIYEKNREILEQAIKDVLDESMDKKANIKWKLGISDVLIYFIKRDNKFKKSEEDALKKTERTIAKETFERCVKQADLPYIMIRKNKNVSKGKDTSYIIVKECENQEKQSKK